MIPEVLGPESTGSKHYLEYARPGYKAKSTECDDQQTCLYVLS